RCLNADWKSISPAWIGERGKVKWSGIGKRDEAICAAGSRAPRRCFFGGCAAIIRQRATQRAIHPVRRTRPAASSASVAKTFRRALPAEEIRKRLIVPAPA